MNIFTNQYEHTIDSKGRMFIPSKYRDMLGTTLYLGKGTDGNLYIMTVEGWNDYVNQVLEKVPVTKYKKVHRYLFSKVTDIQMDSQGRILIPPSYMEHAGLEGNAIIAGCGSRAEIWSPERWRAEEEDTDSEEIDNTLAEYGL